ncbi:hypothetical protein HQ865_11975 [Mucilaginibacter mali]|uniref:Nucleotide-diphospho-sugar transferase n=1 Tax=Mucilaginibacter mali TaxID=2740462 RepID=A0A7D4PUN8_9SPHI|nr:hypothetical protein [Mucilaginibacter mali]QKJ30443.1 hypothetical protein HQ865_11975 [Mucilaginibacter mali]
MTDKRYVLTIATGKKLYLDMAVTLARSFYLWHHDSSITFQLVTDLPDDHIAADIKPKIEVINVKPGELGEGFSPKLHLDKLAGNGQTLFVDSDCIIYSNLSPVFDKFKGHSVSVTGNYISNGEWFGDIAAVCRRFNVPHLPKFNGGIYYLENGPAAVKVYQTARDLEKQYDEIGFVRLRNRPNDEVLMALAMELNGQKPIPDDGSILAEFVNFKSGIKSRLLKGQAELYNKPGHPLYQQQWHLTRAQPAIVHYLGHHNQKIPYIKESLLLSYLFKNKLPVWLARLITFFRVTIPFKTVTVLKNIFRPVYHSLFGARAIKKSERIID